MTPAILRRLWSVVEATQAHTLLKLDDASLVQWLINQTTNTTFLDCSQTDVLSDYIESRLTLIRDLAQER